jgi:hypothetical protein
LAINRTQFKQVLEDKGFDGLNTGLKEKVKELSTIEKTDFSRDTDGEPTL